MTDTDALTWLREVEAAMTPGEWVDGAGDIFAAADLEDGMVREGECEVASCYGRNRQADEAGIVALRNLFPAALAVVEAAQRLNAKMPYHDCRGPSCLLCMALPDALQDFSAAVSEERERHA